MDKAEFRGALDQLKLSQVAFAKLLRVGERTCRRWALGQAEIPPAVAVLVRLMVWDRINADDVAAAVNPLSTKVHPLSGLVNLP